jgi:hypothetical protein
VHLAVLGTVGGGLASSAHEWLLQRLGTVTAQRGIAAVALERHVCIQYLVLFFFYKIRCGFGNICTQGGDSLAARKHERL